MIRWSIIGLLLLSGLGAHGQSISIKSERDVLAISVDGSRVATYSWWSPDIPRPHFKQVFAPNGNQITRRYPTDPVINKDNDDHATYHPGIWLAFGDISGADFWRNKAHVVQTNLEILEADTARGDGGISGANIYKGDESTVCVESFSYWVRTTEHGTLLTMRSVFDNPDAAFYFGDQEEMGLGIRMATALTVKFGSGSILNSEGGVNEAGTWGKQADWCAYEGIIDGKRTGALIVPHWDNFRKSWFHTRDYGLMVANPFGKKAMTGARNPEIEPDKTWVQPGEGFTLGFDILLYGLDDDAPFDHEAAFEEIMSIQKEELTP